MRRPRRDETPRARPLLVLAGLFLAAFLFHAWLEFGPDAMLEADGYYHVKIAQLYRTGECPPFGGHFPWTPFSVYNSMRHDWQLLYHVALVPFAALGPMAGGKWSAVFFAALLVATVYGILRAHGVRFAWAFAGLLLVASPVFVWRMHLPRPTSAFLVLFLLWIHFVAAKRVTPALATTALCLWTYNVPHALLAVGGVAVAVHAIADRRVPWKLAGTLAAGMLLGITLHPGFWQWDGSTFEPIPGVRLPQNGTIQLWRLLSGVVTTAANGNRIEIAGEMVDAREALEFAPLPLPEMWREGRLVLLLAIVTAGCLGARRRPPSRGALIFLGAAAVFVYLSFGSSRFLEYAIPLSVIACALLLKESLDELPPLSGLLRRSPRPVALVAAAVLFGVGTWFAVGNLRVARRALEDPENRAGAWYKGAAEWLRDHSEPGEIVFHTGWDDFGPLFFYNHRNHYLVGFDPYFFYMYDPARFKLWRDAADGRLDTARTLDAVRSFGARFVFVSHRDTWMPFLQRLAEAPGVDVGYTDDHCTVLVVPRR